MKPLLRAIASILAILIMGLADRAQAGVVTITATTTENGITSGDPGTLVYTATPYDFGASAANLTSLTSITVTLTIDDGDSEPLNSLSGMPGFDFNALTLGLDGIDTGIKLNGFTDSLTVTLTITGSPLSSGAILAALQADGRLIGSVIDATPNDNTLTFPAVSTTLSLTGTDNSVVVGTPEPASVASATLATIVGVAVALRRRRAA